MSSYKDDINDRERNFILAMLVLHMNDESLNDESHNPPKPCPFCQGDMSVKKETELLEAAKTKDANMIQDRELRIQAWKNDPRNVPTVEDLPRLYNCGECISLGEEDDSPLLDMSSSNYSLMGDLVATKIFGNIDVRTTYFRRSVPATHSVYRNGTKTVENGYKQVISAGPFPGCHQPFSLWRELTLKGRILCNLTYPHTDHRSNKLFDTTFNKLKEYCAVETIIDKNDPEVVSVHMVPPEGYYILANVACYCNGIRIYLIKESENGLPVGTEVRNW